jgi:hypothetical protein
VTPCLTKPLSVHFLPKPYSRSTFDFSCILLWIFHRISVGKWNSYKMASKSSKFSVEVNSRLRGRSEILQKFTFFEKVDQLSTFKKSNDFRQLVKKKSRNSRFIVKSRLSTSRLGLYSSSSCDTRRHAAARAA